jgi:hypothetical protein
LFPARHPLDSEERVANIPFNEASKHIDPKELYTKTCIMQVLHFFKRYTPKHARGKLFESFTGEKPRDHRRSPALFQDSEQNLFTSPTLHAELYPPASPDEVMVTHFLGYENEQEFKSNLRHHIMSAFESTGMSPTVRDLVMLRYDQVLDFAHNVHAEFNGTRKSGESYSCHLVRTLWFYITKLQSESRLPSDEQGAREIIELMLHDVLEDAKQGQGGIKPGIFPAEYPDTYEIVAPKSKSIGQNDIVKLNGISRKSKVTLEALNATKSKVGKELQHVVEEDPSGVAADFKGCDRLDNLHDTRYIKQLQKLMYKFRETLFSFAGISAYPYERVHPGAIARMSEDELATALAPHLFALGLHTDMLARIQKHIATDTYPPPSDEEIGDIKRVAQTVADGKGYILFKDIPSHFSIAAQAQAYMKRKKEDPNIKPYGYDEIAAYARKSLKYLQNGCMQPLGDMTSIIGSYSPITPVTVPMNLRKITTSLLAALRESVQDVGNYVRERMGNIFQRSDN